MNLDLKKHKLYLLSSLDPKNGRDDEAEELIQQFAEKGFRFFNQVMFISEKSIKEISAHIRKVKTEQFQFFLVDVTENFEKGTFAGMLNPKHFPIAPEANKIMAAFKPIMPELDEEQKANMLFDKIGKDGVDSLSQKEKMFLDKFQGFK